MAGHLYKHVLGYSVQFWSGAHSVQREVERTVYVWSLPDKGGERCYCCLQVGGWGEEGVRLLLQVHSDRLRSKRQVATQVILIRHVERYFTMRGIRHLNRLLRQVGNLHPCRLSKLLGEALNSLI